MQGGIDNSAHQLRAEAEMTQSADNRHALAGGHYRVDRAKCPSACRSCRRVRTGVAKARAASTSSKVPGKVMTPIQLA